MQESYINKVIIFDNGTGCIPPQSICYCYGLEGEYFWVCFRDPILGQTDMRVHVNVINDHGRIAEQ